MFTKCSLSGTSQLSFCDTPLLFRPHLGHQATRAGYPCGFLQHWGYSTGVSAAQVLCGSWFSIAAHASVLRRNDPSCQFAARTIRQLHEALMRICHIVSVDTTQRIQQKTPFFRYGVFFKNKPAMTYSPTPTKVQYHRREES